MKILITGATGFIGKHLIPELGFCEVRCLVRKTSDVSWLKNVELFYGDIVDVNSLDEAMKGIDIVIHMAAVVFEKKEIQDRINVEGTKNVVEACRKNKIKKLIYLSSVAVVYGKETSNYNYSFTKKKAEELVLNAKLNSIILRPSLIYGKGSRLTNIIKLIRIFPIIPLPEFMLTKRIQQPVYVEDVVNGIITAVKTDKLRKNKPYVLAGPSSNTIAQIIDATTIYPFKPIKLKIPTSLLKFLVKIYLKIFPGTPINQEHLSKQSKIYNFDNSEATKDFGYNPIDIVDAIK